MSAAISQPRPVPAPKQSVPALRNGDRLTRAEFERRYAAMPHVKGIELIEAIVYMPSPVRITQHGEPHALLITWVGYYRSTTPGLIIGDNSTNRLDEDNEPLPDLMLLIPEAAGGAARVDENGFVSGAPELIGEISASSVSIDLNQKLHAYRRNGVREYIVWRTEDAAIDWFILREGHYVSLPVGPDGLIRSEVFPGLSLDPSALLAGNLQRLFEVLDASTRTQEHAAFVQRIQNASRST